MGKEARNFFVMVRLSRSELALLDRYAEVTSRTRADAARQAIALAANLIAGVPCDEDAKQKHERTVDKE